MSEVSLELHRLADLLRMLAETSRLIAKRYPGGPKVANIEGVALEISDLADKIDEIVS